MKHLLLALGWAAWGGLHSLLISPSWMRLVSGLFPRLCPFYRLAYNGLAVLTLVPLLLFKHSLAGEALLAWSGALALRTPLGVLGPLAVGIAMAALGVVTLAIMATSKKRQARN